MGVHFRLSFAHDLLRKNRVDVDIHRIAQAAGFAAVSDIRGMEEVAAYRRQLAARNATLASRTVVQPAVRVVNLPPLVVTRTS